MSAAKSEEEEESDSDTEEEEEEEDDNVEEEERAGENDYDRCKQVVKMVFRKPVATTSVSLLIESLVKQLANMLESDETKALHLYNFLCGKLCEMKLIDESYHMTEFEGMREQYERALYQLVCAARAGAEPAPLPAAGPRAPPCQPPPQWSRYRREFEELEYLAGGGFGHVFRVRHKLDGSEYAVKKVVIRTNDVASVSQCLDEVKTFASLTHANIVPYKAAWLELGSPSKGATLQTLPDDENGDEEEEEEENGDDEQGGEEESDGDDDDDDDEDSLRQPARESSDSAVEFIGGSGCSTKSSSTSWQPQQQQQWRRRRRRRTRRYSGSRNSVSEGGRAVCRFRGTGASPQQWATLYIQMALCQLTLKQWLEHRNNAYQVTVDSAEVMHMLQQLTSGVHYMHSKHIVHHDIKPSNVFLQHEAGGWRVQLGDFGLACPLRRTHRLPAPGTHLYAAPEQLAGRCHPQSDLYSIGVVLLELAEPFRTDMERVHCIGEARRGRLPAALAARDPHLAHLVAQLLERRPEQRPDAPALLRALRPPDKERVRCLETMLAERDLEIAELRQSLQTARTKELELVQLREKLKSHGLLDL